MRYPIGPRWYSKIYKREETPLPLHALGVEVGKGVSQRQQQQRNIYGGGRKKLWSETETLCGREHVREAGDVHSCFRNGELATEELLV